MNDLRMPGELEPCCVEESKRNLARHRDVATCDGCGALLLAYGNQRDYERTLEELSHHGIPFRTGEISGLRVISKQRSTPS
jgi:hypothetical protein